MCVGPHRATKLFEQRNGLCPACSADVMRGEALHQLITRRWTDSFGCSPYANRCVYVTQGSSRRPPTRSKNLRLRCARVYTLSCSGDHCKLLAPLETKRSLRLRHSKRLSPGAELVRSSPRGPDIGRARFAPARRAATAYYAGSTERKRN